jgi:RimJ/RimL family protein N-acetyltransferase
MRYYIAVNLQGESIGQSRFSIDGTEATISILIGRHYRGKHLGTNLIARSTNKIFNETPVTNVHAYIKAINNISLNSFTNANYTKIGFIKINGQDAYHLIKTKGVPTHVPAMAISS